MSKRVLLVDDEERVLGLAEATLAIDDSYEITTAADGEEAIAVCKAQKPDLIFLDLLMPKKDGITVCRELKEDPETRDIKIIMLTAMSQEADRLTALKVGADGYMTKPFSPKALLEKAAEMLAA
jgi:two-component system, OmpR family, alkaline phosphatase synthesis response regulator PhoP